MGSSALTEAEATASAALALPMLVQNLGMLRYT